jgi:predicted TIM-barrel fold metal-dependent hydrolase
MVETTVRTNAKGFNRNTSPPVHRVPANACDCHMHIVGPFGQYPKRELGSLNPPESLLDDYLRVARCAGLERNVVVQPSFYARDNACTLDAVEKLGNRSRAVVVVDPDIPDAELRRLHARGARGIRFQMIAKGGLSFDALEVLAPRIAPLGWHVQLWLDAKSLPELESRLRRLPTDIVFDHMAHVYESSSMEDPGFRILLSLLEERRCWVKLSNGRFAPDAARARRFIATNSERVVWGSDWPHVSHEGDAPDDGELLDRLWAWAPDDATVHAILVDNPTKLYFAA